MKSPCHSHIWFIHSDKMQKLKGDITTIYKFLKILGISKKAKNLYHIYDITNINIILWYSSIIIIYLVLILRK